MKLHKIVLIFIWLFTFLESAYSACESHEPASRDCVCGNTITKYIKYNYTCKGTDDYFEVKELPAEVSLYDDANCNSNKTDVEITDLSFSDSRIEPATVTELPTTIKFVSNYGCVSQSEVPCPPTPCL